MFDVNQIVSTVSLHEIVTKAGAEIRNNRCACPLHGGHDASGFAIYREHGRDMWICFTDDCGSGDVIDFVKKWRGMDFTHACEFLGGDVHSDPLEMQRLARLRVENEKRDMEKSIARYQAALAELRFADKHVVYHDNMQQWARDMWTARGLDESMQDFFTLGSCESFAIGDGQYSPTLTLPIFDEQEELLSIRHRLVKPISPNDKYRPEGKGLGSPPFLAVPRMGYNGNLIIVMEGEIKAAVTWANIAESDVQTIGVAGRTNFTKLIEPLQKKNVIVIPDPGAEKDAYGFAKSIHARYLPMTEKIDDYILQTGINTNDFYRLLTQQSRKV